MKKLLRLLSYTLITILIIIGIVYVSPYRYLLRGVQLTYLKGRGTAYYLDKTDFEQRKIENSGKFEVILKAMGYNKTALSLDLQKMLDKTHTGSFLVLRNDSLINETYFGEHTDSTPSNAFSMAKSIITILVQIAIQEGKIKSWDEKVKSFLPWIEGKYADKLTLRHLSTMTSGSDWDESYKNPFGVTAKAYYGSNILGTMQSVRFNTEPGLKYHYQSGNTELLGMALSKAVGMSVSQFASDKLWKPLNMEFGASWHLDKPNGTELTYCCLNAISRDFARIGIMLEHMGAGIVDSTFLSMAFIPYKGINYGHSFWSGNVSGHHFVYLQGTLGQNIIVIPDKKLIIVRTGNGIEKGTGPVHDCVLTYARESLKLFCGVN